MSDSTAFNRIQKMCANELDVLSLVGAFFEYSEDNQLPDPEHMTKAQLNEIGATVEQIFYRRIVNSSPEEAYQFFYAIITRLVLLFPLQYIVRGANCREEILAEQIKLSACLEDPVFLKEEYKDTFEYHESLEKGHDGQEE